MGGVAPLIVLTLWMGVYPTSFSTFFDASVAAMVKQHTAALAVPANTAAAPDAYVRPVMVGEGRPSTTLIRAAAQDVDRGPEPAPGRLTGAPAMTNTRDAPITSKGAPL